MSFPLECTRNCFIRHLFMPIWLPDGINTVYPVIHEQGTCRSVPKRTFKTCLTLRSIFQLFKEIRYLQHILHLAELPEAINAVAIQPAIEPGSSAF